MKKEFETSKLYLGYPVFILGYKDERNGYNITTSSSSYTLGDMMVIGLFQNENSVKQIQQFKEFTLNIPDESLMVEMEQAGFVSGRDKFAITGLTYEMASVIDAPLLSDCPISLECVVEDIQQFGSYINLTARIVKRWVDDKLLDERGHLINQEFDPIIYMGDGRLRSYRYLEKGRADKSGSFIRRAKKDKKEINEGEPI